MTDAFRANPDITIGLATKSLRDRFMSAEAGHIIVVDDDSTLRQMVVRYLEDHDVPTRAASSKDELKRHLEGAEPILIILDLRLGQDDGLDLLREIRSYSDVPVIITTGHRPDERHLGSTQRVIYRGTQEGSPRRLPGSRLYHGACTGLYRSRE